MRILGRLRALLSSHYRFILSGMNDGPGYLELGGKRKEARIVAKSVRIRDIAELSDYQGDDVVLDFDAENRLIGIEIL